MLIVDGRALGTGLERVPSFPVPKVLFCSIAALFGGPRYLRRVLSALCRVCGSGNVAGMMKVRSHNFVVNNTLTTQLNTKFIVTHGPNGLPTRMMRRACTGRCKASAVRVRGSTVSRGSIILLRSSLLTANKAVTTARHLMREYNTGGVFVGFVVRLKNLGNEGTFPRSVAISALLAL